MERIHDFDHRPGRHCGAAALRNVAEFYGWRFSEAACFGIGGGAAFVLYEHSSRPWVTFRTSPTWLVRAFFERLGIPHQFGAGEDFETTWQHVTAHVDDADPVVLFLDPTELDYLEATPAHLPPHVAVVTGYDDETVQLSDGAMPETQEIARSTLRDAWQQQEFVPLDNEFLVVSRARITEDQTDAVAAGLRQAATYMLEPLQVKRDARGPGEEGLPALRSFADYLGNWTELPNAARPVRAARRSIDEHGDGQAFRGLFAEALEELGQRTGLPNELAGRMAAAGRAWGNVATRLDEVLEYDDPPPVLFEEAGSAVGDIAGQEEAVFAAIADELGVADGR